MSERKVTKGDITYDEPLEIVRKVNGKVYSKVIGHIRTRDLVNCGFIFETHRRMKNGQVFHVPKYQNKVGLSKSVIEKLEKRGINDILITFIGVGDDPFNIFFKISDFKNGEEVDWEDPQYLADYGGKPRIYRNQQDIWGFVGK